jgi:hypothetical protein
MNLAVFGANGQTGQLMTKQALAAGHMVTTCEWTEFEHTVTCPVKRNLGVSTLPITILRAKSASKVAETRILSGLS